MHENEESSQLRKALDAVYTPLSLAKIELQRRRANEDLRKKVEEFLGLVPGVFYSQPRATLGRQILSPNFELLHFIEQAKETGLKPLCFGYLDDKLVTKNLDKYYLCKLVFTDGIGKHGGERLSALRIVDFNTSNGKKIRDVKTIYGNSLADFHESLAKELGVEVEFFDASQFLKLKGGQSAKYYRYFLALFIYHGILFENYLLDGEYAVLTKDVLLPNFEYVEKYFGLKPIIVQGVSDEQENDLHWRYYPQAAYDTINKMKQVRPA